MQTPKQDGLIAATFTPFKADGQIDLDPIPAYVDFLVEQGVSGIYICGSTGEGPSLTIGERKELAAAFVAAAGNRLFTFVQVGHNSLKEAAGLARHAASIGADAISAAPPSYFKVQTLDALIGCLSELANAAPEMPLYHYHIPILTGSNLDMVALLEQAEKRLPSLRGIKYTSFELDTLQRCLSFTNYEMMYGRDELFLSALAIGVKGFIGSTYNFTAPLYLQIRQAFANGDLAAAQHKQAKVAELVAVINRYGGLAPQKIMMQLAGIDCGPVRLPLLNLNAEAQARLHTDMKELKT